MALTFSLPTANGTLAPYTLRGSVPVKPAPGAVFNRIAYSAAHVVADPLAAVDPWLQAAVDWDATIAYRRHLWSLGLGVAEAMDTAQRGMGLDWATSLELIRRSLDAAQDVPGALVASGCGTDHLSLDDVKSVDDVIRGYEEQMAAIEALGGKLIVMASRALARVAKSPADYERVYDRILRQTKQPVVLHWLGDMFDPALSGYWGTKDVDAAMDTALGIIAANAGKVDGIKISLLDKDKEIAMRRRLPATGGADGRGVRMYTGDDFNYAELIAGDGFGSAPTQGKSDALLGIFDAIAPAASAALGELAQGHVEKFHAILGPTVALSRHIFAAPTRFYKTGVVFMAWLNGHQSHFSMVGGQQSTRSLVHFAELLRLADAANLLEQPELAVQRMKTLLALHGVEG
ncbi:dihydrodipicolinate synthase family protein [Polaromonas sp. C04]|uniref:dihydrodipicolinate synthase family protein n=1 Tax=Polaromonas sp. C04 TaxID=1945857 RepID=UPI000984981A|nr:dihydrodipicolinate synthase family protein [Polaromonas sp. C04]OOG53029.1 dihydrodipicolinate synthase family protein [Polaromonas sp. C04]